jgi:tRNA(Ile)-lysidine synthase
MSRLVILAGKRFGISLSQTHVESVLRLTLSSDPSASLSLPEGLKAYRKYSELHFSKEIEGTRSFPETELIPGQWVEIKELGRAFFLSSDADTSKINGSFNIFFFKKRAVCGKILVRPRKTGDTFKPDPRGCRKTLKKLFIEKKIPLSERELIFVVADDTGVLFVEGFGADERVLNDPGDERIAVAVKNI